MVALQAGQEVRKAGAQTERLPQDDREEKSRIMQRILRNDAEIRVLAEPWLAQVEHMFERPAAVLH